MRDGGTWSTWGLFLVLSVVLVSCGSGERAVTGPSNHQALALKPAIDLTGTWVGTVHVTQPLNSGPLECVEDDALSLTLNQSNGDLTGSLVATVLRVQDFIGSCSPVGLVATWAITGTVNGNTFDITGTGTCPPACPLHITGRFTANEIIGSGSEDVFHSGGTAVLHRQ